MLRTKTAMEVTAPAARARARARRRGVRRRRGPDSARGLSSLSLNRRAGHQEPLPSLSAHARAPAAATGSASVSQPHGTPRAP